MKKETYRGIPFQTELPFIRSEAGIKLQKDKFIHYLRKSLEITEEDSLRVFQEIQSEYQGYHGESPVEFIQRLIASKIQSFQVKKPLPRSRPILTKNAEIVLNKRYLKIDQDKKPTETAADLFARVAKVIASAEEKFEPERMKEMEDQFYEMMAQGEFLPNSPTLMNAGRELGQLSACFVLPVEDSMESIFEAIKHTAIIQRSGGGTGFSFSRLRPKDDVIQSTKGISTGPVSFMSVFNTATDTVKQGGTRRGANMGILHVTHPDIFDFINAKKNPADLTNFNISVAVTEEFMKAVEKDEKYSLINPHIKRVVRELRAREVFDLIVQRAWEGGDPGLIFIDRINRDNPTPAIGEIESTNPCGEIPLLPYESCNLGSINLSKLVIEGSFDWERLQTLVHLGVRFLDNVIEANRYPLSEIDAITKANRKIGLGVMGWADTLILLGIPYNSQKALDLAAEIMGFIQHHAQEASSQLAKIRGAFPNFDQSIFNEKGESPLRNATVTTVAPTGTLSLIAGCSSGIEPLFAVCLEKHVLEGERLFEVHPHFEKIAKERGFYSEELLKKIGTTASIQHLSGIPDDVKELFVTSFDIASEWHIRMQAAFQRHTDNAVSKTINFSESATVEDIRKTYWLAYELGCKGITIYRNKSRQTQVLNIPAEVALSAEEEKKVSPSGEKLIHAALTSARQYVASLENLIVELEQLVGVRGVRSKSAKKPSPDLCPECGNPLVRDVSCLRCTSCGFSQCD